MRTARIIVTRDCPRNCPYCCSNDENLRKQGAISVPAGVMYVEGPRELYDAFVITGGEPMLYHHKVVDLVGRLRNHSPAAKFYLHTAWWPEGGGGLVARAFDGVNYTIHADASHEGRDLDIFREATECLRDRAGAMTNRLTIHPTALVCGPIGPYWWATVDRHVWPRIEIMNPLPPDDCPIPKNEDLYVLEGF